ncbi:hypothetical protein RHGRI_026294 [Rhododendron griersonianum]|uniref:Uncharacterized protein n=1 Tax=Rhododendron griersonianum TaxID=479676 RepID=A0AAV6IUK1_9ERIC|nr:hypothetical protein RHGRI_026294 [Rhododendron griersonianum]
MEGGCGLSSRDQVKRGNHGDGERDMGKPVGGLDPFERGWGFGGVMVLWDSRVVEKVDVELGMFSASCLFKNVEDGFRWVFSGVYGPVINRHRGELWDELSAVAFGWGDPSCLGGGGGVGDFNVVRFPDGRMGCNSVSRDMRNFSDFINNLELVDPPHSGSRFTWFGAQENRCLSRIDRFLFSIAWEEHFSNVAQSADPSSRK